MRSVFVTAAAFLVAAAFGGGIAQANVCQTDHLLCATTMPVDGFCSCVARGQTEYGTVVAKPPPHRGLDATAGGCGRDPKAPGCQPPK